MVRPGRDDRNPRVNFVLPGRRTALMVCQAMSMAMTVVLPAPVASFRARRMQLRVGVVVGVGEVFQEALAGFAEFRRDLGQPDGGFDGFDLAEEGPDAVEVVMPPVLEQACGFRRYLPVVRDWASCATGRRGGGVR